MDVTPLRDALLAALPSRYFHREDMDNLDVLAALDTLIAAARLAGWEEGHDCECDAALARSNEQSAYADLAEAQRRELDLAARLDAAVEARAALTPERLIVAVVDALMAEEVGDGHYRWQFENIVRPAILAALTTDKEPRVERKVAKDIDAAVDELERLLHPEGRCATCGGGKPYWKHDMGRYSDHFEGHPFTPEVR